MNKIALYLLLLFSYLGLYKSFSPNETAIATIKDIKEIDRLVTSVPATAILENIHSTGSIIKTYYLKIKVIYPFYTPQEIVVRASKDLAQKYIEYIGLSIYRKEKVAVKNTYQKYSKKKAEEKVVIDTTPVIPGLIFLNKSSFGWWKKKKGNLTWSFYRTYRELPNELGWGKYRPSRKLYKEALQSKIDGKVYYGLDSEFGPKGKITQKSFPKYFAQLKETQLDFKKLFKEYLNSNFSKIRLE